MGKTAERDGRTATIVIVACIVLIAALLLIYALPASRVKTVHVSYVGAARDKAAGMGLTDTDFVRASGVTGQKSGSKSEWEDQAKHGVASLGYFKLDEVRLSGSSANLIISARTPLATISTAGKYVTLDEDKYVLTISDRLTGTEPIKVFGAELRYPAQGEVTTGVNSRLDDALIIAKVIRDNGLTGVFTEISMLDNQEVRLATYKNVPVKINLRFDVATSLDIAKSMLDKGVNDGSIEVAGENGFHKPAPDFFQSSNGM
ncbi:MAG: hypothetical protein IKI24_06705 [Clostridia bacterium]|nr:hypothetical protein [Clostridia bacterium]MCR4577712.1 hypothetical protein [Clostridiales bacterium]